MPLVKRIMTIVYIKGEYYPLVLSLEYFTNFVLFVQRIIPPITIYTSYALSANVTNIDLNHF